MNLSILAKRRAIAYKQIEEAFSSLLGEEVALPSHRDFQVDHLQKAEAISALLSRLSLTLLPTTVVGKAEETKEDKPKRMTRSKKGE